MSGALAVERVAERPARPIRCAVLTASRFDRMTEMATYSGGLELGAFEPAALGVPDLPNPFALPPVEDADVALLSLGWVRWIEHHHPDRLEPALRLVEQRVRTVVGVDGEDDFALGFPPEWLDRVEILIKGQGVFRDRDLYNYVVGPRNRAGNWIEKTQPQPYRYTAEQLAKIRLGPPYFLRQIVAARRASRALEHRGARSMDTELGSRQVLARDAAEVALAGVVALAARRAHRALDVHCAVSITNPQRLQLMPLMAGYSGRHGVTRVPEHVITPAGPVRRAGYEDLLAAAGPYLVPPVGRGRYLLDMCRHRVVIAPAGYGELTIRHAEGLRVGAAVVCQDLSHAEVMFPVVDHGNVVFCRHDYSDLRERVDELLADDGLRVSIARHGRRQLAKWSKGWRGHLYAGFEAPIREVLG